MPFLPQLFAMYQDRKLVANIAKIVDDLLFAGHIDVSDDKVNSISARVELGTIVHGAEHLRYFGLSLHKNDDFIPSFDGDDKLATAFLMQLSHLQHRDLFAPLSAIESKAFKSLNSTIGWLGITASPFRASFA